MADDDRHDDRPVVYEGIHCTLTLSRPRPGVIVAVFVGHDVGEFGSAPLREMTADIRRGGLIELFIDGRATLGASMEVSLEWAEWMKTHRESLAHVSMLTANKYLQLTADFVRSFTAFGDRMRIYTSAAAFDEALAAAGR